MAFKSILFADREYENIDLVEIPDYFVDLNLDQVINAITAGRQEYNLKPFYYLPIQDVDLVYYRHEVAQDLQRDRFIDKMVSFTEKMVVTRRYLRLVEELGFHYHREGWFLEAALVYCEAIFRLADDLTHADLRSRGFLAFRDFIHHYVNSAEFISLLEESQKCKQELSVICYSVIIKGNLVRVRKYEAETDYSQEVEHVFEKFQQGAVKDYRVDLALGTGLNHVKARILDCVAKLFPGPFGALDEFCTKHASFFDQTIRVFDREIQFYVAYLDFTQKIQKAGLRFCYPEVGSQQKEVFDYDGFDIALANKFVAEQLPVICNDFHLKGSERVIVVSGPNQGGKTTFARAFGQLHYLASLGCPVPGNRAHLFLFDKLFTHFEKEEKIKNLRGKLQDDLVRIHEILGQATPQSIIIMNEIFTSTTLKDAVFLSKKVMEEIVKLDMLCVCVTFIDELSSMSVKTVSMVSTVVPENPAERTFKILRRPSDGLAFAISIAEKYHLTYELLRERIRQ